MSKVEQENPHEPQTETARKRSRLAFALAWLFRPDEVGQPLTLRPRGVRLLVLLILGNVIVLALLTFALYQAATLPLIVESPFKPAGNWCG